MEKFAVAEEKMKLLSGNFTCLGSSPTNPPDSSIIFLILHSFYKIVWFPLQIAFLCAPILKPQDFLTQLQIWIHETEEISTTKYWL